MHRKRPQPRGGRRLVIRSLRIAVGLPFGEIADNRNLEALAIERLDQDDDPEDKQSQIHHQVQRPCEPANERHHSQDRQRDSAHNPRDAQKDRLPGVKADERFLVVRRNDQEDNRRDDGDVSKAGGGAVTKAILRSFVGHGSSFLKLRSKSNTDSCLLTADELHDSETERPRSTPARAERPTWAVHGMTGAI